MSLVYSQMYTPIQANAVSKTRSANSSIASQSEEGVEELKDNSEYGNTEDSSNGPIDRSVGSTENNIEKENEEKKSNSISILGVVLGGLMTLLGTIVSSILGSKEASRQREFQLEQEREKRNDEYNKELMLNRKTTYIAYLESLFNLYYCIKNNSTQYDECFRNASNNYAKIALIGSKDVVDKSRIIIESVYISMIANDLANQISELEKSMQEDIEKMTVDITSNTDTQPS